MDLFNRLHNPQEKAPLAERMRPRTLDEFAGQKQLLGEGRLLERAAAHSKLPSLILWGPPGSGKTTLARILASQTQARFVGLSAVMVGLKEVRKIVDESRDQARTLGKSTVFFLDEIHRFNKAQQDSLLPHVEAGTFTLIGATTENPSFEVNAALLSRCKTLRLERLTEEDLVGILRRALEDGQRGLGDAQVEVDPATLGIIAKHADGDARKALGTLEVAASLGTHIDEESIREALQKKILLHDRSGEQHYNIVSAFIKSMRGSDPDASVYWMARMIEAGEDPVFVCRRMVIFAAEDVGLADPQALAVANAAANSVRFVGMPEAVLPLTMAALYLARAPKSNTALETWSAARSVVQEHGALEVPKHICNAPTPMLEAMGYAANYKYPHNFDGHQVDEVYLPEEIRNEKLYRPSGQGGEK